MIKASTRVHRPVEMDVYYEKRGEATPKQRCLRESTKVIPISLAFCCPVDGAMHSPRRLRNRLNLVRLTLQIFEGPFDLFFTYAIAILVFVR